MTKKILDIKKFLKYIKLSNGMEAVYGGVYWLAIGATSYLENLYRCWGTQKIPEKLGELGSGNRAKIKRRM